MSSFKDRSDYFKLIASKNKLIAHNKLLSTGGNRVSFFRINNEEELSAACKNWAHFPCVVHAGHNLMFNQPGTGLPQMTVGNHLYFLAKLDSDNLPFGADQIEDAYDKALQAMMQFVSYMINDKQENGVCGEMFLFDLNRAKADMIGPYNSVLYGWYLYFADKEKVKELKYDANLWEDGESGGNGASSILDADTDGITVTIPDGWEMIQYDFTNVYWPMWVYTEYNTPNNVMIIDFGDGPKRYETEKFVRKYYTYHTNPTIKIYHNGITTLFVGNANGGTAAADNLTITGDMPNNLIRISLSDHCTTLPVLPPSCNDIAFSQTSFSLNQLNSLLDNLIANGTHNGKLSILTNPRVVADNSKLTALQNMNWNVQAWGFGITP